MKSEGYKINFILIYLGIKLLIKPTRLGRRSSQPEDIDLSSNKSDSGSCIYSKKLFVPCRIYCYKNINELVDNAMPEAKDAFLNS